MLRSNHIKVLLSVVLILLLGVVGVNAQDTETSFGFITQTALSGSFTAIEDDDTGDTTYTLTLEGIDEFAPWVFVGFLGGLTSIEDLAANWEAAVTPWTTWVTWLRTSNPASKNAAAGDWNLANRRPGSTPSTNSYATSTPPARWGLKST